MSLREEVGVPGQESPLRGTNGKGPFGEDGDEEEDDFSINVGRALDYLSHDVPLMFSAPPRLEIFTPTIVLKVWSYCGYHMVRIPSCLDAGDALVGGARWLAGVGAWRGRSLRPWYIFSSHHLSTIIIITSNWW